jgi:hypothetical protein
VSLRAGCSVLSWGDLILTVTHSSERRVDERTGAAHVSTVDDVSGRPGRVAGPLPQIVRSKTPLLRGLPLFRTTPPVFFLPFSSPARARLYLPGSDPDSLPPPPSSPDTHAPHCHVPNGTVQVLQEQETDLNTLTIDIYHSTVCSSCSCSSFSNFGSRAGVLVWFLFLVGFYTCSQVGEKVLQLFAVVVPFCVDLRWLVAHHGVRLRGRSMGGRVS